MRKFPFSKKAINIMIATALLVTPLASLAPVGGNYVVSAQTSSYESYISDIESIYAELSKNQDYINEVTKARAVINAFEVSDWNYVIGAGLTQHMNDALIASPALEKNVENIAKAIAELIYTTRNENGQFKIDLDAFRVKYENEFHAIFGEDDNVTVEKIVAFFGEVQRQVANDIRTMNATELLALYSNEDAYKDVIQSAYLATVDANIEFSELANAVKISLNGTELIEFFAMQTRLNEKMNDVSGAELIGLDTGTLKVAFAIAVINAFPATDPVVTPTPDPDPEPTPGAVDGDNSTTSTNETSDDGTTKVVSTVDTAGLTEAMSSTEDIDFKKVSFSVKNTTGETAEVRIPSAAFDAVATKNPNAEVEIQSSEGTIRVPVKVVDRAAIAQSLGVNAEDVTINVSIKTSNVVVKQKDGTQSKSKVVEFKITATAGNNSTDLNIFNDYISRDITADDDLNADRAVVVLVDEAGNIVKSVPSQIDGKKVTFKNRSNSLYTIIENDVTFPDITTSWAKATIEKLASKMVIAGMPSGNFEPKKSATRAEFAALLTRSLGLNKVDAYDNSFKDVKGSEWFVADMMAAVDAGIIEGHADGSFKGNDPVTREQAAAMIARAIALTGATVDLDSTKGLNDFADQANVSAWAASAVEQLIQAEIITGRPNAQIAPKGDSERAEITVMLERFLKTVNFMN